MLEPINLKENERIVFPQDISLVISKIMEKYGLVETEEEILEKLKRGETFMRKEVAEIVKRVAEGKISYENFPFELKERLNISLDTAEKLAEELTKKVLIFAKKIPEKPEEEIIKPTKKIKPPPEEFIEREKRWKRPEITEIKEEKPKEEPKRRDIYREPIE
jgi:hypothetical protein